ncbi:MAG: zinc-ribbon domain-containing protein [Fimbriimonadaceae bacterium]|nr:zinc-ribbon domain-containing protein [Fimbriimonadaceae bacterium]
MDFDDEGGWSRRAWLPADDERCTACGEPVRAEDVFCPACGEALAAAAEQADEHRPLRSPSAATQQFWLILAGGTAVLSLLVFALGAGAWYLWQR